MNVESVTPPKIVHLLQVGVIDEFDMKFTHLSACLPIVKILHGWYFLTSSVDDQLLVLRSDPSLKFVMVESLIKLNL